MRTIKFLAAITTVVLLTTSCVSNRKIASMRKLIDEKRQSEKSLGTKIATLDEFRVNKSALGELDDKSNLSIQSVLDTQKKGVQQRTDSLNKMDAMLAGNKRIKIKDFKNIIIVVSVANDIITEKSESIDFVDQLLKQETFVKFNSPALILIPLLIP